MLITSCRFSGQPAPTTSTTTVPAVPSTSSEEAAPQPSLIDQVKLGVASVAKSFTIDMWLARHTPQKVLPILHTILSSMREEFADSVAFGGGIYAVGYCFGAKYVLLLAGEMGDDVAAGQRLPETEAEPGMVKKDVQVKCAVIAHGTQITVADLVGVEVPLCVVAVSEDPLFPDEVREEGVKGLREKGTECEVEVFKGMPHGFAVLGDYGEEGVKESQGKAFGRMVGWLKGH